MVGSHAGVRQPARGVHFFPIVGIRLERGRRAAFLTPQFVVAGVGHRAHQPGLERSASERGDALKGRNERFLSGIGGEVFISEDAERGVVDAVLVMQDKCIEGVEIAFLRIVDEGLFVHWR